ncbi:alpha/beta hydrolase [uncultured Dokdonia sp.]|uniref:alpha/beta fold hydrolase n=1 Tax=uncultured Dokdonia sp. TaxID=575653 RepID=UPI002637EE8F|nr:alpha/beta hydrolase [uncultured Dokdonia sp.]
MNQPLVLLHGALGSKEQFKDLKELLSNDFDVHTLNFEGHGDKASSAPFSMRLFATNVIEYLQEHHISKAHLFGYSMGGYVALQLAKSQPERVDHIFTLGTKFLWTPESAANEIKMLNPEKIEEKVPAFAQKLAAIHTKNDWKDVMRKTATMMYELGNGAKITTQELTQIQHKVSIGIGTKDHMVSIEESKESAAALPNGELHILEETQHIIDTIPSEKLKAFILDIIKS